MEVEINTFDKSHGKLMHMFLTYCFALYAFHKANQRKTYICQKKDITSRLGFSPNRMVSLVHWLILRFVIVIFSLRRIAKFRTDHNQHEKEHNKKCYNEQNKATGLTSASALLV